MHFNYIFVFLILGGHPDLTRNHSYTHTHTHTHTHTNTHTQTHHPNPLVMISEQSL